MSNAACVLSPCRVLIQPAETAARYCDFAMISSASQCAAPQGCARLGEGRRLRGIVVRQAETVVFAPRGGEAWQRPGADAEVEAPAGDNTSFT